MDARKTRVAKVAKYLKDNGIGAALFADNEGHRDPSLRYLSGQPNDAMFVVSAEGKTGLCAWDINMANQYGLADRIDSTVDYGRDSRKALKAHLDAMDVPEGSKIALPPTTSYPEYIKYVEGLDGYDFVCEEEGPAGFVVKMRSIKDADEIALYRKAAAITDGLMDRIEAGVRSGAIKTEMDAALFIERECRVLGCEAAGFETLAAGPARSFGIHAFPNYTAGEFGTKGMTILDFGVKYEGYITDVTMTFVRDPSPKAREMIELVKKAYSECVALCAAGTSVRTIAGKATEIFAAKGYKMPHSLGHGVGLETHEYPLVSDRAGVEGTIEPGMIFTIEPGLYDPEAGGVRYEDDVLVTEKGREVITHSRIVEL